MPKKPSNPFSSPDLALTAELARDLEEVVTLVRKHLALPVPGDDALALVRVLEGVSSEAWERFSSTYGFENWLSVPLQGDVAESVTLLLSLQERLAFQRDHDALTGIGNRGYFNRRLDAEVERALRSHTDLSLLYIDLDHFKQINDTYGHACGDAVLQRLARVMQNSVRHYDIVARIGGEEFAIILPATSCWTGVMLGNRLLEVFRQEQIACGGEVFSMTFSGGVSSLSMLDGESKLGSDLLNSADTALYEAKRSGRDKISLAVSEKIDKDRSSLVQAQEKQLLFSGLDTEIEQ